MKAMDIKGKCKAKDFKREPKTETEFLQDCINKDYNKFLNELGIRKV